MRNTSYLDWPYNSDYDTDATAFEGFLKALAEDVLWHEFHFFAMEIDILDSYYAIRAEVYDPIARSKQTAYFDIDGKRCDAPLSLFAQYATRQDAKKILNKGLKPMYPDVEFEVVKVKKALIITKR